MPPSDGMRSGASARRVRWPVRGPPTNSTSVGPPAVLGGPASKAITRRPPAGPYSAPGSPVSGDPATPEREHRKSGRAPSSELPAPVRGLDLDHDRVATRGEDDGPSIPALIDEALHDVADLVASTADRHVQVLVLLPWMIVGSVIVGFVERRDAAPDDAFVHERSSTARDRASRRPLPARPGSSRVKPNGTVRLRPSGRPWPQHPC